MKKNKQNNNSNSNNQDEDDRSTNHKATKSKVSTPNSFSSQFSFNHLSKMLLSLHLITSELTNEHKICLEFPSIDIDLKKSEDIGGVSINTTTIHLASALCSYDIKLNSLFKLYKSLSQKDLYSFEDFNILLQIFSSIFSAFNDTLFQYDLSKDLFSEQSPLFHLYTIEDCDLKQTYQDRIDSMYSFTSELTDSYTKNLLCFISAFSLFGDITYQNFTHETIASNLKVYNSIFITDFKLFLLIHFHLVILINITIKKSSIDKFLTAPINKKKDTSKKLLYSTNIPTVYFIDNYSTEHLSGTGFQQVLVASIIKYHLLPYVESLGLNNYNLTILSYEALRWLSSNMAQAKADQIKYDREMLLTTAQFIDCVNDYDINEFNIILDHSFSPSTVSCILSPYLELIVNAKLFNAETEKISNKLMLQYEDYMSELDMVIGIFKFNLKIKKAKNKRKSLSKNYSFRFSFNSFTITIKKDLSIKDKHIRSIIVFLSQKHFSEEDLVNHISKRGGITAFYNEFRKILSEFQYLKKYSIGIRISQHKIANAQLQYYFGIIYLHLQHYLHKHIHSHSKVVFHETEAISPQKTIVVNNIIKQKQKLAHYNKYIKKFELGFISILNQYIAFLIEYFDHIVVHYDSHEQKNPFNPRVLLRNFNENILMIVTDAIYIDFIIYMHENEYSKEYHEKIMNWIELVKLNPDIAELIRNITVIMNKQYLAEKDYYNTDSHLKRFLSDVNTLYLIDKEYDLILQEKKMIIYNRDTDSDSNQLETFINIIKNCYDTIQYVTSNQLREYNNFGFVFNKNKHLLQFKGGCMSLRKITAKGFTSLFAFDPFIGDNSYPIINALTGKSSSNFSFNSLIKLFKNHYLKLEDVNHNNIIDILHNDILSGIYNDIAIVLLKMKYYALVKAFLPKAKFDNMIVCPIKLNKIDLDNFSESSSSFICREITVFQFENTKLNFYSNNDLGRLFSILKTEKSLSYLRSNAVSYSKSRRGIMIDHLAAILWVLNRRTKQSVRIMKNVSQYIVNRDEYSAEGIVSRYLIDFNVVANEVRKYKKKANQNLQIDDNKNDMHQGSFGKRKGSVIIQDNNCINDQNDKLKIYRTNSGRLDQRGQKKNNKNCIIF